jgi:putative PEP-CTERM system histidine kinase
MLFSFVPFAAAGLSVLMALVTLMSGKRTPAKWCFFAGMAVLAADSEINGLCLRATDASNVLRWLDVGLIVKSFMPGAWLGFSLTYSRGDYPNSLAPWKTPLGVVMALPILACLIFQQDVFEVLPAGVADDGLHVRIGFAAKALTILMLIAHVCILMNLERTFRSAVGTMRWRIKFVVLGLGLIFGARIYVRSQALVYSSYDLRWLGIESSALLIGCVFLALGYVRTGFVEINVYPSSAVLRSSLTVLIVGGYLFTVGVLANIVKGLGGGEFFQLGAFVVLLGVAGAVVLLFSERLRHRIHQFVSWNFKRAQHDSVRIWTEFSGRLANVTDQTALCAASAKLISETFNALSVAIWVSDEQNGQLVAAWSTSPETRVGSIAVASYAVAAGLRTRSSPFDLDRVSGPWADELCQLNPVRFLSGGSRWCVPLRAGEHSLGAIVLADRVNGASYTFEELNLLQCIANHATSVLLNCRLASDVARAREMEAMRTMSAFFVHDLKNTAASLNLMLKNAQTHFNDPAFREDALRGIGNSARRIDEIIGRLTTLRQRPDFKPVEADLNRLVSEVLETVAGMPHVELTNELQPLPNILLDPEQIRSVVTNLVLNARDAVGPGGRLCVRTEHFGSTVVLSVADNGCGMSPDFVKDSLFRPFQSTKKKGLGIGLFQSRTIVEAHGGNIRVESEMGKGTTFRVSLPAVDGK